MEINYRFAICDDEPIECDYLKSLVKRRYDS